MPIPTVYRKGASSIASYDAVDLLSGTGYISLYGGKTDNGYILSNIQFYSESIGTYATCTTTPDTLEITANFDVEINRPIQLKGKMIVTTPLNLKLGQSNEIMNAYDKVYLKRVATTLYTATGTTATTFDTNDTDGTPVVTNTEVDISEVTRFKRGETLRVTVEVYAWQSTAGGTPAVVLYHDPRGRAGDFWLSKDDTAIADSDDTTVMLVQLPVRIDI